MVPTKAKVRKTRGSATLTPQAKRIWRVCSKRLAPSATVWGQHQILIDADEVAVTVQQDVTQKLDALVKAVMDLSRRVEDTEDY